MIGPLAAGLFCLAWAVDDPFPFLEPIQPPRAMRIVANRAVQAPENTRASLEWAIADGFEWASVDVRRTRDGRHVLIRDANLDRTTNGVGPVEERTLEELQTLDAGSWFAKRFAGQKVLELTEALELARGRINLRLDCRRIDPDRLAREVLDAGMASQVLIASPPEMRAALSSGGRLALLAGIVEAAPDLPRPAVVEADAADLDDATVRAWHDRGVKVMAVGDWKRAAGLGVDWIRTDRPEEVAASFALEALGPDRRLKISHHRGASHYAPENTLAALAKSIRMGADFVEFDIRPSRDGRHFLLHDGNLDRTTNGKGPIRGLDAVDVGRLDAGAWFGPAFRGEPLPTLDAFLDAVAKGPNGLELYVDAKDISPEALVEALRSRSLVARSIVYQGADYLARLRAIEPELRRLPALKNPADLDDLSARVAPYAVDAKWPIITPELTARCHDRGIRVFGDAMGFYEAIPEYRRAIRAGIDVIQTDHPLRVLRALELEQNGAARDARLLSFRTLLSEEFLKHSSDVQWFCPN